MTAPTWQEACTPVTQAEYVDVELAALEAAGSPINGWSPDAPQRALVEGEATAGAAESQKISQLAKTASPTTCIDAGTSWVRAVIGWFDITTEPAVAAVWDLTMVVDPSAAPITVSAVNASTIQAMSNSGVIFLCTQASPVLINSTSLYQGTIRFTARDAGTVGNVTPGTILKLISGPSGLDILSPGEGGVQTAVTVGANEESDAALITRGLGRWGVIFGNPNGTAGWTRTSFNFLIPHYGYDPTADPALAVTRWSVDDSNPVGPGTVVVTIANASGPATSDEVTAVQTGLTSLDVKPVGSGQLYVQAAVSHGVTVSATLQTDGSNPDTAANATSALETLGSAFPLGLSILAVDLVREILMGAPIATATVKTGVDSFVTITLNLPGFSGVQSVPVLSLGSNEVIGSGEVLEITVGLITVLT